MRDSQRQKVYDWENTLPEGKMISFDEIEAYVNYVWDEMNLKNPPKVLPFPHNMKNCVGDATRFNVRFHDNRKTSQKTILHELAHSMTCDIENNSEKHNEIFVGMYIVLMEKFLNFGLAMLWYSAEVNNVKYEKFVKPTILDSGKMYQ